MIKDKLLSTKLFINNQYLDLYVELIKNNLFRKKQKFITQRHHIIPVSFFKIYNIKGKDSKENLVNLLYKDHILAHYYLALCLKESELRYKMIYAINFILGRAKQNKLDMEDLRNFVLNLDKYQKMYEESKKFLADKIKGTTRVTSAETKKKIGKANSGRIYINKDGIVKTISSDELENYLLDNWKKGNPNSQKRKQTTGYIIVHLGDVQKYIPPNEIEQYLDEGWERGRSKKHKEAVKQSTISYYNKLTKEEIRKKCASRSGCHWTMSEETKEKISRSNIGRKQSEEQKIKNSERKKGTIHMTNGIKDIMIKKEFEQDYINLGYHRGRNKNKKESR